MTPQRIHYDHPPDGPEVEVTATQVGPGVIVTTTERHFHANGKVSAIASSGVYVPGGQVITDGKGFTISAPVKRRGV